VEGNHGELIFNKQPVRYRVVQPAPIQRTTYQAQQPVAQPMNQSQDIVPITIHDVQIIDSNEGRIQQGSVLRDQRIQADDRRLYQQDEGWDQEVDGNHGELHLRQENRNNRTLELRRQSPAGAIDGRRQLDRTETETRI